MIYDIIDFCRRTARIHNGGEVLFLRYLYTFYFVLDENELLTVKYHLS